MRHRYPFEALRWLRQQRVDRHARALGESAQRAVCARDAAARAEAVRRSSEQNFLLLSDAERVRLDQGLVRAADLKIVGDWQTGAAAELAAQAERERRAREVQASAVAAELAARRALATASNDAKLVDAHRDAFQAQRASAAELSEEDAVAEQWTARHLSPRRS